MKEEKGYKKLIAWQEGMRLAERIYQVTKHYPKEEIYGLTSQMRRSSQSISANIAEGYAKYTPDELRHGARMTFGSASELETQLELSRRVGLMHERNFHELQELLDRVLRLTHGLAKKSRPPSRL